MCFVIHPRHADKKIAKRDIVCYKVGFIENNMFIPGFYPRFHYLFGKKEVQKGKDWPTIYYGNYDPIIEKGFHSFSNKKKLKNATKVIMYRCVKCIIPKGTEYYYNPTDKEYVSRALIVLEEIQI